VATVQAICHRQILVIQAAATFPRGTTVEFPASAASRRIQLSSMLADVGSAQGSRKTRESREPAGVAEADNRHNPARTPHLDPNECACMQQGRDPGESSYPDLTSAHVEGGLLFGPSAAVWGEVELGVGGEIVTPNLDRHPIVRTRSVPVFEVHLIDSTEPPTGVDEGQRPLRCAGAWRTRSFCDGTHARIDVDGTLAKLIPARSRRCRPEIDHRDRPTLSLTADWSAVATGVLRAARSFGIIELRPTRQWA
jgi:CDGSH-type Zn-finger protein